MAQAGANFTGAAAGGDLSGTYPNPAVAKVGGQTAANVASGAVLANAASNLNTASTIVKRDASGNFSAGTVTLAGTLALPATTSSAVGVITLGGSPFAHNFGVNTFLGANAGNFTMTGFFNTATGSNALSSNTSGSGNTGSGLNALYSNTTGFNNTATGSGALLGNTTGANNTAGGFNALYANTTGYRNTAIGSGALFNNTTGVLNIAIGDSAGLNLTTGNNNIDIGNLGAAAESNTIRIGTQGTQTNTFIAGISSVPLAFSAPVAITSFGQLGVAVSSRRYKFDIGDMGNATEGLMRLRPVTFRYLAHGENAPLQYGLIAEEVAEVYPELVTRNKDGEVDAVMYQFLAPMLLNEVQKQHQTIDEQQKTIEELRTTLNSLRQELHAPERQAVQSK